MGEKVGSWIEDGYYDQHPYVCSYCGEQIPFPMSKWMPRYCPSCGAKMVPITELTDYEEMPIDLDGDEKEDCVLFPESDFKCDDCPKPHIHKCFDSGMKECRFPFGECCADNLQDNVARICFENDLDSKVAKALIDIITKERERNECLYVHREYREN